MRNLHFFVICLVFRLLNSLLVSTMFAPDEHWQGPEVAHRMVFGYGHLTWEWAAGLRGYLHPTLYAILYWVLAATGIDNPWMVAKGPMLVQSVLAALSDLAVYNIAQLLFNAEVARWTAIVQILSWFNSYCLVRTYSSSVEASITATGIWMLLSIWFVKEDKANIAASRLRPLHWYWQLMAALSVVFRPSSILFWGITALMYVLSGVKPHKRRSVMEQGLVVGFSTLAFSTLWDRIWYGRWVFVPWNFFSYNLLKGGSEIYGVHPWHWNFTSGLPAILASLLPLMLVGVWQSSRKELVLAAMALLHLIVYSLPAHKEFRFLLPAFQLVVPYCGKGVVAWSAIFSRFRRKSRDSATGLPWIPRILILLQVPMTLYLCTFHQRAQMDVMRVLRDKVATQGDKFSLLFLTPCHATPYYAHIHRPGRMRFIDCSPPGWSFATRQLNLGENEWLWLPSPIDATDASMQSQRQLFEAHPETFLSDMFSENPEINWPQVIVGYTGTLAPQSALLQQYGYNQTLKMQNCLAMPGSDDTECMLSIYEKDRNR